MPLESETAINILETCKKTGERDYLHEYEINLSVVESLLLEAGFPCDKTEDLSKYALDLAAMAVFKHKIGINEKSVSLGECFALFMGRANSGVPVGKGTITDLSWNQTLEQIIEMINDD